MNTLCVPGRPFSFVAELHAQGLAEVGAIDTKRASISATFAESTSTSCRRASFSSGHVQGCADGLHRPHNKGRPAAHTLRTGCQTGDDRPGGALRVRRRLAWAPVQHVAEQRGAVCRVSPMPDAPPRPGLLK